MANMTAEQIQALIDKVAAQEGVADFAPALKSWSNIESAYGQAANRKGSQYQGVFQMGEGASADVGLALDKRNDPDANIRGAINYAKKNAQALGLPLTLENSGKLYLAHQQGAGGAKKILAADPNAPIAQAIGEKFAASNNMKGKTVAQGIEQFAGRAQKETMQWAGKGGAINRTQDPSSTAATLVAGNNAVQGSAVGAAIGNATIPQSQLGAVTGYNANMIDAATQVANKGKEAINAFDWNPAVAGSSAARFGQAVQGNTNTLTDIANKNMRYIQDLVNPQDPEGTTGLQKAGRWLKDVAGISGSILTNRYLEKMQQSQSATGAALANQVGNMAKTNALGVVNPEVYDKAAGNASQQQQVDTGTFNAVTGDANQREQTAAQVKIAEANAASREGIAATKAAAAAAKGTANDPDDNNNLLSAAREMGMNLPGDANTSDMKAVLGPRLQAVQYYLANGRSLGQDPYTALKTVEAMGDMAPPELAAAGAAHRVFINAIQDKLAKDGLIKLPNAMQQETKEQQAARNAANEAVLRTYVGEYYQAAADGTLRDKPGDKPSLAIVAAASPYAIPSKLEQRQKLANGIELPKGVGLHDLSDPIKVVNKSREAGASTAEQANFFKQMSLAATKGVDKYLTSVFKAPAGSGHFYVKSKYSDSKIDLATPAGIEQLKALEKMPSSFANPTKNPAIYKGRDIFNIFDDKTGASDTLGINPNQIN